MTMALLWGFARVPTRVLYAGREDSATPDGRVWNLSAFEHQAGYNIFSSSEH